MQRMYVAIFLVLLLSFFCAAPVQAQANINEVNPTPATGNDWIELYNTSNVDINLTGWTLQDSSSLMATNPVLTNQILKAKDFFVIEVGNRLNSGSDQVKLITPMGEVFDFFAYDHTSSDQSWAREVDGSGNMVLTAPTRGYSNQLSSPPPTPSASPSASPTSQPTPSPPASPTIVASPSPSPVSTRSDFPDHIIISELMACPNTSESEWVELENLDNTGYTLTNWQLKDSQSNSRYFTTQIAAQGLTVIQIAPAMLNNSGGDLLQLIRPDGELTSSATYSTCTKGESLVFDGQNWIPSNPTPGLGNPDLSPTDSLVSSDSASVITENTSSNQTNPTPPPPKPTTTPKLPPTEATTFSDNLQELAPPKTTSSSANPTLAHTSSQPTKNLTKLPSLSQIIPYFLLGTGTFLLGVSVWIFHSWYTEKSEETNFIFD